MIQIKEVKTNKELKTFVKFPNKLYKDNKYYVPELISDDFNTLHKDKNPAYEFSEGIFYLAYKDNQIVGRIGILVNHKSNEKWGQNNARFTHFDFIDDYEVSSALMNQALAFCKKRKFDSLQGPLGLTDFDHQGMLIDGFDQLDMFITLYNHPYYIEHMEKMGFEKEVDWVEYQIEIPDKHIERYDRLAKIVKKKYGYKLVEFTRKKDILPWAPQIFKLYNEAYSKLFGTTILNSKQIDMYIDALFGFVNPDFVKIVLNKNDEIIGFGIALPSISKALQKSNGKLLPFGFIHLLKALKKNDTLDLCLIAIHPDYQGNGANALLIDSVLNAAIKFGMKLAETGPELETNKQVQSMWKHVNPKEHRRRRVFKKTIS